MNDTLETSLPAEDAGKLDETIASAEKQEQATEDVTTDDKAQEASGEISLDTISKMSKEEILARLTDVVEQVNQSSRHEVDALKQAYYKIRRAEVDALKTAFLSQEEAEEKDFVAPADEIESKIKGLLTIYKEKKAEIVAEEERVKAANYALKLQLIEHLKELTESQDDFNKLYNDFKNLQARWKEVKQVPQEHVNELWKNYQMYTEQFYDIIKINNQFRDYDFKKNLEMKVALCEAVEKLEQEPDVVSAFHQMQKLHQQWRELGPVSKELRDEIWARFKAASTVVNKKHQDHFEILKGKEEENLEHKTALCVSLEAIDYTVLKTFKDWEEKNKEVLALQAEWKTIGFAPKRANVKIFERFRAACDTFFEHKSVFYKEVKEAMEKNLALKTALCEKAEALKDSTEWRETTDKMIALQKEWKTVGSVSRKYSDAVWKRFISACDYFFDKKNKTVSSQKSVEQENLAAKKAVIVKIQAIDEASDPEAGIAAVRELMDQWNAIGHVPFKEKDNVYAEYHTAVDKKFDVFKVNRQERRMQNYRSNVQDMQGAGRGKLLSERDKLVRNFERMKTELQTYENNIGFFSISSKGGGGLVKDMEKKIEILKNEIDVTMQKIKTIDDNMVQE